MRKLAAIGLGLVAYAAVAACAHSMDQAQAQTGPVTWNLHMNGDEAKLAYGQPNSDLVGVMLTCERGSGMVTVAGDVSKDRPVLVLASGRETLKLQGQAEPDPYTGGLWMEAEAPVRAQALARFERTGDLAVKQRIGRMNMNASDTSKGDIQTFFAHCEA